MTMKPESSRCHGDEAATASGRRQRHARTDRMYVVFLVSRLSLSSSVTETLEHTSGVAKNYV